MLTLKNILPATIMSSLMNFIRNGFVQTFNFSNTATGAHSVTINAKSGVATFTDVCSDGASLEVIILNSYINANSSVSAEVEYTLAGKGLPQICYSTKTTGQLSFMLFNAGGDPTDTDIVIKFTVL